MIPRHQVILFSVLLVASLVMGVVLWQLRERAHQRMVAGQDSAHTQAPVVTPAESATLLVANDSDGSLLSQTHSLPLPSDPGSRGRAVLGKLLDLYAATGASHPVPGGASSVAQVFLLPAENLSAPASSPKPGFANASPVPPTAQEDSNGIQDASEPTTPQLAVINLTGAFVASHPSGLEAETLTILSLCGTLHANLPRVTQVRFLVDGVQRPTLAGHADLTRTYLTSDAVPAEANHP